MKYHIAEEDWELLDLESLENHLAKVEARGNADDYLYAADLSDYIAMLKEDEVAS
jgi:hypothetical protein